METGWLYDGAGAVRHEVEVAADGDALIVRRADGAEARVPRGRLCHIDTRGAFEVYGQTGVDGWRLGLPTGFGAGLLPPRRRYGSWIDRIGLWRAAAIGAAASLLFILGASYLPALVAPFVPRSIEEAVGAPVLAGLEGSFCSSPAGDAALARLSATLAPESGGLDVRIVSIPIVNAAALPGGHILLFEPLLLDARGPDEVAGVLAHEIAHIEQRHVTEAMVREFTFSLFVTLVGGTTGANLETFLGASYSRGAEAEADEGAIAMLRRARISPVGAADFFARIGEEEERLGVVGRSLSYLSTHPQPGLRERRFRASAEPGAAPMPSLSPKEWQALRGICRGAAAAKRR